MRLCENFFCPFRTLVDLVRHQKPRLSWGSSLAKQSARKIVLESLNIQSSMCLCVGPFYLQFLLKSLLILFFAFHRLGMKHSTEYIFIFLNQGQFLNWGTHSLWQCTYNYVHLCSVEINCFHVSWFSVAHLDYLPLLSSVAVLGAGLMGAGIAQVWCLLTQRWY